MSLVSIYESVSDTFTNASASRASLISAIPGDSHFKRGQYSAGFADLTPLSLIANRSEF